MLGNNLVIFRNQVVLYVFDCPIDLMILVSSAIQQFEIQQFETRLCFSPHGLRRMLQEHPKSSPQKRGWVSLVPDDDDDDDDDVVSSESSILGTLLIVIP